MPVVMSAPSTPPLNSVSMHSPRLQPIFGTVMKPISRLPKRARESSPPAQTTSLPPSATSAPLTPLTVIDASPPASPTLRRLVHLRLTDSKSSPSTTKAPEDVRDQGITECQNRSAPAVSSIAVSGDSPSLSPKHSVNDSRSRSCTPESVSKSPVVKRRRRNSESVFLSEDESEDETSDRRMSLPLPPQFRIKPSPLHSSFSATLSPPHQPRQLRSRHDHNPASKSASTVSLAASATPSPRRDPCAVHRATSPRSSPPVLPKARARLQQLHTESHSKEAAKTEIDKVFALGYGRGLGANLGGGGVVTRRQSALRQSQVEQQDPHEEDIMLRKGRHRGADRMEVDGI